MPLANRLLIRWGGGYTYREDGGSVAAVGAKEAFLSLADVQSVDEMDRIADASIARFAAEQVAYQLTVKSVAGKVPLVDYGIGDTVTLPAIAGGSTTARVSGMVVTEDDEGNPFYAPEVGAQLLDPVERIDRAVSRMAPGTLGGRSESATPIIGRSPAVAAAPAQSGAAASGVGLWLTSNQIVDPDVDEQVALDTVFWQAGTEVEVISDTGGLNPRIMVDGAYRLTFNVEHNAAFEDPEVFYASLYTPNGGSAVLADHEPDPGSSRGARAHASWVEPFDTGSPWDLYLRAFQTQGGLLLIAFFTVEYLGPLA